VTVKVAATNLSKRQIDFVLVDLPQRQSVKKKSSNPKTQGRKK
jgi:hypothetical protein